MLNESMKKLVVDQLKDIANKIDHGECEITTDQALNILQNISHEPISKQQACWLLDISRSTFDRKVQDGSLPPGRHRAGFKELVWYRDELLDFNKIN